MRVGIVVVSMLAACGGVPHTQQQACADITTAVLARAIECGNLTDEIAATQQNAVLASCCQAAGGCVDKLEERGDASAWKACKDGIAELACESTVMSALPPLPKDCAAFAPVGGGDDVVQGSDLSADTGASDSGGA